MHRPFIALTVCSLTLVACSDGPHGTADAALPTSDARDGATETSGMDGGGADTDGANGQPGQMDAGALGTMPDSPDGGAGAHADLTDADALGTTQDSGDGATLIDADTLGTAKDSGDSASCGPLAMFETTVVPDFLIVLDRSGSMQSGSVNRWTPAVSAITSVTASFENKAHFGLIMFPGAAPVVDGGPVDCNTLSDPFAIINCLSAGGGFGANCQAGKVDVAVGPGTASAIASTLGATTPGGSTPTSATLDVARTALAAITAPSARRHVVLVTDGAPNCVSQPAVVPVLNDGGLNDAGLADSGLTDGGVLNFALNATVDVVAKMASEGITTFVLGYSAGDATLAAALDLIAAAGSPTGTAAHHVIQNEAELRATLSALTASAAACEIKLTAGAVSQLTLSIDGTKIPNDGANGFTLAADQQTVVLHGSACGVMSDGTKHAVVVRPEC